ncbi:hypothetical protein PG911_10430 [Tenacibaculum ovolyticum]|uniref:hypothetical protein n=1 Tax=Tenacibaculum ovolyticum TaxID=104270 RepID=UPI0022F40521|nr:hypothetical protein [Tenacibaculum ovolyticum]WBX75073.1 hypothetical protein PG911_10430 [Tenacibaculum ovolyticum]
MYFKNIICGFFIFSSININAQDLKQQGINEILQITQFEEMFPKQIKYVVDNLKKENQHIPESYWGTVLNNFDYQSFIVKTKKVYYDNYSLNEITEIINSLKTNNDKKYEELNLKAEDELHSIGYEFGLYLMNYINKNIRN